MTVRNGALINWDLFSKNLTTEENCAEGAGKMTYSVGYVTVKVAEKYK